IKGKSKRESLSGGVRAHIRTNVVGYVALFFALGLGTAWANHEQIFTDDIVNGQVRKPDVGLNAVGTDEAENNSLTASDLATDSVGWVELAATAFNQSDIAQESVTGGTLARPFGIAPNGVSGSEVANNSITRSDLAAQAEAPAGFSFSDGDTGIICNAGCTEGSLALPAGTYAVFGKIKVSQEDVGEDVLNVRCELNSGTDFDQAQVLVFGDVAGGFPSSAGVATLSMQGVLPLSSGGGASIECSDGDIGDVSGSDLKITAIKLGSLN
ncbi:MAG: hypothetical protein ACRDL1_03870, partial [Solirubrobacterales bacterium]